MEDDIPIAPSLYSLSNKMDNSLLAVRDINHKYIVVELERLIRDEIGDGGYFGFCHEYWCTKKKILKNRFGIEWNSPVDLNPMLMFD